MGSLPGLITAFSQFQKYLKLYMEQQEVREALGKLEVGEVHRAEIDRQAMPRFRGGKKRRYGLRAAEIERLKDAP